MNYMASENEWAAPTSEKTLFTFTDTSGEKSTLTLDKWVADALSRLVGDVHAWIQSQYDGINAGEKCFARYIKAYKKRGEEFSRLTMGDMIRAVAFERATSEIDDSEL